MIRGFWALAELHLLRDIRRSTPTSVLRRPLTRGAGRTGKWQAVELPPPSLLKEPQVKVHSRSHCNCEACWERDRRWLDGQARVMQGLDGEDDNVDHCGDGEVKEGVLEDLAPYGRVLHDKVWAELGEGKTQDNGVEGDR